ncbi:MAG: hypothetical protein AB7Y74_13870 [Syntrophorhabdus sp.]
MALSHFGVELSFAKSVNPARRWWRSLGHGNDMRGALLDKISEFEDYSELHKQGVPISEIRAAIRDTIEPYLKNKDILKGESVYYLSGEAINVRRITLDSSGPLFLNQILAVYWNAYRQDPEACTDLLAKLDSYVQKGKEKYISISLLERDKTGMDTETLAHEIFQIIGTTIEGPIKPFLDELLCLFHMQDKQYTHANILSLTLGKVVNSLFNEAFDQSFLYPGGFGVTLSQWRNIAQHLSFSVAGSEITATYGRRNQQREVTLKHNDLIPLLRQILLRLSVLKAARVLFTWDNIQLIGPKLVEHTEHPDSLLTDLAATFLTQGFRISRADSSIERLQITLTDLRAKFEDPNVRAIHASQFLAFLSQRVPGKALSIEHLDPHRNKSCEFSLTRPDAKAVGQSNNPFKELSRLFTFKKGPNKANSADAKGTAAD